MKNLRDIFDQLKPGDIVYQSTDKRYKDYVEDVSEYNGDNKFGRLAVKNPNSHIIVWEYPVMGLCTHQNNPKRRSGALYTLAGKK